MTWIVGYSQESVDWVRPIYNSKAFMVKLMKRDSLRGNFKSGVTYRDWLCMGSQDIYSLKWCRSRLWVSGPAVTLRNSYWLPKHLECIEPFVSGRFVFPEMLFLFTCLWIHRYSVLRRINEGSPASSSKQVVSCRVAVCNDSPYTREQSDEASAILKLSLPL